MWMSREARGGELQASRRPSPINYFRGFLLIPIIILTKYVYTYEACCFILATRQGTRRVEARIGIKLPSTTRY